MYTQAFSVIKIFVWKQLVYLDLNTDETEGEI